MAASGRRGWRCSRSFRCFGTPGGSMAPRRSSNASRMSFDGRGSGTDTADSGRGHELPCDREQVLVAVLRRPFARAAVGTGREVEEVAVGGRRALGVVSKAPVDGHYRSERLLVELDVVTRARGS